MGAPTGTLVRFLPDDKIFETSEFSYDTLAARLRELAFLNNNVTISLADERTGKAQTWHFDGGIVDSYPAACSAPGGYLRARGQAFLSVMSPRRFLSLSASIDRHRVHPERIASPTLLIGAESDQLVFAEQLRALNAGLAEPKELHLLDSLFGHDMFLKEAERIGRIVAPFLAAD